MTIFRWRLCHLAGVPALVALAAGPAAADGPLTRAAELAAQAAATVQPSGRRVDLTLDEAVKRALDQNLDIKVSRLNPQVVDLTAAQIHAAYWPVLFSNYGQRNATNLPTTQLVGGQKVKNDTTTYNVGQSQLLPWGGGSYTLTWNNTRLETTNSFATFNPSYSSTLAVNFTQPLLKNFTIDSNRQQLLVTKLNREISDIQLRATITNTLANVRNAYWDLVYATENLGVQGKSLALAEELLNNNKIRVEVGTMAPIDVVQAEAEVARARQNVTAAEATLQNAQLALKRLIVGGRESDLWNATIQPVDRPALETRHPDVEAAIKAALQKRTDLEQLRRQLGQAQVNEHYYSSQKLPQVDLVASYQAAGLGGNQILRGGLGREIIGTIPGGFADALTAIRKLDFPTWNAQVNITYPIGRNANDALYARAKLQAEQTKAQLQAAELQVATDLTQAATSVETALKQIETSRAARELSERRLEAEQSKFEVGMSTNFFVVQAQRDLADARNAELLASLNYRKALVDFDRLQDAALQRAGISFGGSTGATSGGSGASSIGTAGGATGGGGAGSGGVPPGA